MALRVFGFGFGFGYDTIRHTIRYSTLRYVTFASAADPPYKRMGEVILVSAGATRWRRAFFSRGA